MAVVESIPEKNQTPSAQKGVLDYCMQPSKTFDEGEQLAYVSGYNCIPELANESFLTTQKIFGHEPDGVRFYHFVQSFKTGENISPQEANDIGMDLVKGFQKFKNHEAIVATHIDKDHLHKLFYKGLSVYGTKPTIKSRLSRLQEEYSGKRKAERKNLWNDL